MQRFVLYHGTNTFWIRIPHGDLGTNCVELGLHLAEYAVHLAEYALMKLVPESVEDTKLSTNKQHSLSPICMF